MEATTERIGKVVHISQLLPEQLKAPVPFDLVELTDEEREQVILEAKVRKHARLEDERKKVLAEHKRKESMESILVPNGLYSLAKWRATLLIRFRTGNPNLEFEPREFQRSLITALCFYFCKHENFEKLDAKDYNSTGLSFSLNKGLWIWGNPGVGKSLIMEMFSRNMRLCYDIIQCPKLCYAYQKHGDEAIADFMHEVPAVSAFDNFHQKVKGICYNDLGTEALQSKHYGNPINVMQHILLQTYENLVPYWHRHVITNLTFDQVKESYGIRVTDRIKECFNIIEVKGESLRK